MPIFAVIDENKVICDCCDLCGYEACGKQARGEADIRLFFHAISRRYLSPVQVEEYPKVVHARCPILEDAIRRRLKRRGKR